MEQGKGRGDEVIRKQRKGKVILRPNASLVLSRQINRENMYVFTAAIKDITGEEKVKADGRLTE